MTTDYGFSMIFNSYVPTYQLPPFLGQDIPVVLKLDSAGNIEWSRKINPIVNADYSGRYPVLQSCACTKDGGCAILGYSDSMDRAGAAIYNSRAFFLIKLDNKGNILLSKTCRISEAISSTGLTYFGDLLPLNDGGFLFDYADQFTGAIVLCRLNNKANIV